MMSGNNGWNLRIGMPCGARALLVLAFLWMFPLSVQAEEDGAALASAAVGKFHQALLELMGMDSDRSARRVFIAPLVTSLYDVATISRISLGKTWRELDSEAQQDFMDRLQTLIVETYLARFVELRGQSFETIGVRVAPRGWVVSTVIGKSDGGKVSLDYYFRNGKVYNVVADGVSDLSLRRAEYASIVKKQGYGALLSHIDESIAAQSQP